MSRIIYVTGGQRSGKSRFAQSLAEQLSPEPLYLATAHCWDAEFADRIKRHQRDRGAHWSLIEEELELSRHPLGGRVVLLDCITLWWTNIFTQQQFQRDESLIWTKEEWARLCEQDCTLIVVSNEIGLGVIPMESSTRAFVDLQGWMNQHIAGGADEVHFLISGIAQRIK